MCMCERERDRKTDRESRGEIRDGDGMKKEL